MNITNRDDRALPDAAWCLQLIQRLWALMMMMLGQGLQYTTLSCPKCWLQDLMSKTSAELFKLPHFASQLQRYLAWIAGDMRSMVKNCACVWKILASLLLQIPSANLLPSLQGVRRYCKSISVTYPTAALDTCAWRCRDCSASLGSKEQAYLEDSNWLS